MRLLAPLLIAATLPLSGPANGQIVGRRVYDPVGVANPFIGDSRLPGPPIHADLADLRQRIERGRRSGMLSRSEARQLRREVRLIGHLAYRYGGDGLSASERAELESRSQFVRGAISRGR